MSGAPLHVENYAAYDFAGTAGDGTALPWDTTRVAQGSHTITQSVTATSGAISSFTATFTLGAAKHPVALHWTPSTTPNVNYKVSRATVSGGPYTMIASGLASAIYTDTNVQAGSTYFYVTSAVNSSGIESTYSNQVMAQIPTL
jgi:cellulose 1,4-beta-cellobiosidase